MDRNLKEKVSIFSHWYWIWLVSAFFVSMMVVFFFFDYPGWFHFAYRGVSLSHEMNYAVWWSGICLFLAAIVFATAGTKAPETGGKAWVWYILALAMLALCYDEVGSLHETVARVGGWWGLLPFALGFAIVFGIALYELLRIPTTRVTAVLIVIGIGIFVGVAGLEVLEHDAGFQHNFWRRVRLVGEEAVELVAMGVLITSGLIALVRMGIKDTGFLTATAAVEKIMDFPLLIFTLFVLQLVISIAVIVPNYTFFPEGNPSALFPMLLFFCLSIVAMQRGRSGGQNGFWKILAVLLLAASILQMYNLNTFINNLTGLKVMLMTGPPLSWVMTAIPLAVLCFYQFRAGRIQIKRMITLAVLLFLVYLLVFPDLEFRYRIEYLYFLFSSAVAYSCYQVMSLNQRPEG